MGDIEGVGMGVPGPIKDDGTVLKCVNLGWGVFNVAQSLSVLCGGIKVKACLLYTSSVMTIRSP